MTKENNSWINVNDQEPEINSVVLCFDSVDSGIFIGRVKKIVSEPISDDFNSPWFKYLVLVDQFDGDHVEIIGTADYWQPLPGKPELY
ncbi:hypothetical protein [Basfia succiniciproducens]|uniref:hypothetical protein n=1 Tax=Basfia succiniciproducens TaxID=653940 RepID=UPI003FCC6211